MYLTLSEFPLALGAYSTDSTRADDIAAALVDMLATVDSDLASRAARNEWGATLARSDVAAASAALSDVLHAMRPDGCRPDILKGDAAACEASDAICGAFDVLDELAPTAVWVGMAPDDGACLCVCVDVDDVRNWVDGWGDELPDDMPEFEGESFLVISDHGNATFYESTLADGAKVDGPDIGGAPLVWREVWSVV